MKNSFILMLFLNCAKVFWAFYPPIFVAALFWSAITPQYLILVGMWFVGAFVLVVGVVYVLFLVKTKSARPEGWISMSADQRSMMVISTALSFFK